MAHPLSAELAEIKAQLRELCIGVLDGTAEREDAIACVQLYGPELDPDGLGAADAAMPRN